MKKNSKGLVWAAATLVIVLAASGSILANFFWNVEKIKGNGVLKTEERSVRGFSALTASNGLDVFVKNGSVGKVVVETDENLHEIIKTEVSGSTLKIYTTKNITRSEAKKITVYVNQNTLKSIKISSAADLVSDVLMTAKSLDISASSSADFVGEVKVDDLKLSMSSSADIKIKGSATKAKINGSSSGDLDAEGLLVQECTINSSSSSDAKLNIVKALVAHVSSSGEVEVKGRADKAEISVSSGGGFKGYSFKVKECEAKASSGGDIQVYVLDNLDASASSGGDITFKGNPTKVSKNKSSGGSIDQDN
ncbi:head GIN domain-containing protein [Aureibacter tunicatorum]|uniref:Putative auto-transporter adhesin head GIN domain-containing protein n=1 Tax=Aureibacter tunicatorum TaxID=866807 RepID=A0AAE3XH62_9BACT|nr:head GIN domain-containing protein [Aureibacter tunicatorum]MDR6237576.1 hypothetical protein [Aureibacter tunicatorum]BDD02610.1 hypothetical protein AUTU_00930 [Aureibacter tunicatorum]